MVPLYRHRCLCNASILKKNMIKTYIVKIRTETINTSGHLGAVTTLITRHQSATFYPFLPEVTCSLMGFVVLLLRVSEHDANLIAFFKLSLLIFSCNIEQLQKNISQFLLNKNIQSCLLERHYTKLNESILVFSF